MLDLVKVIQEESYTYRDPITSFIEDLYVKFDFDSAQQKLRECEAVLSTDFFLVACLQVRDFKKFIPYNPEKFSLRDHPFKTSAIFHDF